MEECFWHFPLTKPEAEWSEFDRDYVELMRTAYAEGHRPREGPGGCVDLGRWPEGRSVSLVHRGRRNGWEPFLGDAGRAVRLGPSYGLLLGGERLRVRPSAVPSRAAHLRWSGCGAVPLDSIRGDFEFVGGYPCRHRVATGGRKINSSIMQVLHNEQCDPADPPAAGR